MAEEIKDYVEGALTVRWDPSKCTHSGRCVRGLPAVFDPRRRPWIDLQASDADAIRQQVRQCPSGALSLPDEAQETDHA